MVEVILIVYSRNILLHLFSLYLKNAKIPFYKADTYWSFFLSLFNIFLSLSLFFKCYISFSCIFLKIIYFSHFILMKSISSHVFLFYFFSMVKIIFFEFVHTELFSV